MPFLESGPMVDGGPTYQYEKLEAALEYVKAFGHAVDVGAHCGLWSRLLVKKFHKLSAFEPLEEHRICFKMNVIPACVLANGNVNLFDCALGNYSGQARMAEMKFSTGDAAISEGGIHETTMARLDEINMPPIDFLKIDCEGYELFVLKGGEETIRRDKPTIVVEQKPGHASRYGLGDRDAVELLKSWGAKERFVIHGDFCLSWD